MTKSFLPFKECSLRKAVRSDTRHNRTRSVAAISLKWREEFVHSFCTQECLSRGKRATQQPINDLLLRTSDRLIGYREHNAYAEINRSCVPTISKILRIVFPIFLSLEKKRKNNSITHKVGFQISFYVLDRGVCRYKSFTIGRRVDGRGCFRPTLTRDCDT